MNKIEKNQRSINQIFKFKQSPEPLKSYNIIAIPIQSTVLDHSFKVVDPKFQEIKQITE